MPKRAQTQKKVKGYVYRLTDERILERLETEDTFTDVFGYGEAGDRQLALMCFEEGVVSALAVMVRGQAVASYKRVVRFSSVTELETPVDVDDVLAEMAPGVARSVRPVFETGGMIEPHGGAARHRK